MGSNIHIIIPKQERLLHHTVPSLMIMEATNLKTFAIMYVTKM